MEKRTHADLRERTYEFARRILKLWKSLPPGIDSEVLGKQLIRCGTSIGANYRAATVGKSDKDFLNKIRICLEEADESQYGLALIEDHGLLPSSRLADIRDEAKQLTAIMASSAITVHKRLIDEGKMR